MDDSESKAGEAKRVAIAVGGASSSERLIEEGQRLAAALGYSWEAIHVETPGAALSDNQAAAHLLGGAAERGASIVSLPASDVAAGLASHLASSPADFLLIGAAARAAPRVMRRRTLADRLAALTNAPNLVVVFSGDQVKSDPRPSSVTGVTFDQSTPRAHAAALLMVALAVFVALLLRHFAGAQVLDLLFLCPVIAAAAQYGLRAALTATVTSVLAYNFFLSAPLHSLSFRTPQGWLMAAVLTAVAIFTSIVTGRLRSRVELSDRSAAENARIASFGQSLALAADWESTGQVVSDEIAALLGLEAAVLREKSGKLEVSGATPARPVFSPVDEAALDWCWANRSRAGSGTDVLPAANWRFEPLGTSLGMLAVLAIASSDGRDPIRADQAVLLATLVAQAALAHERLRLEDEYRVG